MVRQIVTRYNGEVNGYFLCDRGRYGYEFVNGEYRIRQARLTRDNHPRNITKAEVIERLAPLLAEERQGNRDRLTTGFTGV